MNRELKREVLNYAKKYNEMIGMNPNGQLILYQGKMYYVVLDAEEVVEAYEE